MAIFKVGQRVRVVGASQPAHQRYIGTETIITSRRFRHPDGWAYRTAQSDALFCAGIWEGHLAPLTDPDQEFAEKAVRDLLQKCKDPIPLPLDAIPFGE